MLFKFFRRGCILWLWKMKKKLKYKSFSTRYDLLLFVDEHIKSNDVLSISSVGDVYKEYHTVWYYE